MPVKFLDLGKQYQNIKDEIEIELKKVFESGQYSGGLFVEKFEDSFSNYCGTKYASGVSSGTSALWIALKAVGVGEGDEVITAANSFIATAEAISMCGAKPVFVDVDFYTSTIDVEKIEQSITEKTKAIIPVHLYGQLCDMSLLKKISTSYGIKIVEDAAQAHGAQHYGVRAGAFGDVGCFSFYPGKNLGAYGEAGAVVTNDHEIYKNVCMIRDHGQERKYSHACIGSNERMDGIQGAVLNIKLEYIDEWNEKRKNIANRYNEIFSNIKSIRIPFEKIKDGHVYHIYQIEVENRIEVINALERKKIGYGIHYPCPIHLQRAYRYLDLLPGSFPVSEEKAGRTLSLPVYPELNMAEVEFVANEVIKSVR